MNKQLIEIIINNSGSEKFKKKKRKKGEPSMKVRVFIYRVEERRCEAAFLASSFVIGCEIVQLASDLYADI